MAEARTNPATPAASLPSTLPSSSSAPLAFASEMSELKDAFDQMQKRIPKFLELQQSIDRFSHCFGTLQANLFGLTSQMDFPPQPEPNANKAKAGAATDTTHTTPSSSASGTRTAKAKARARASDVSVLSPADEEEDNHDNNRGKRLSSVSSTASGVKRRREEEATTRMTRSTSKKTPSAASTVRSSLRNSSAGAASANSKKSSKKRKLTFSCPPSSTQTTVQWKWEKTDLVKIPKKYQAKPELKKLETILLYLQNTKRPISIAELVKHSSLPVIKSKEMLQTLMTMDLVERNKDKSGFSYTIKKQ